MHSPCRAAKSTHAALMANLTTLGISARAARALDGDTDRLRYQLHKCVAAPEARPGPGCARGTCAAATKPQLRVVVVGCSMTQGFMNCGTTLPGRQCAQPCYSKRWPKLLEASLQRALPRCRVMVAVSTSRGGRTVTTASRYATRVARAAFSNKEAGVGRRAEEEDPNTDGGPALEAMESNVSSSSVASAAMRV